MKTPSLKELNKKLAFPMPKVLYEQLLPLRNGKKIKDMFSPNSEDVLTLSLFRAFFHIGKKGEDKSPLSIPVVYPSGSFLKINFNHTEFYVWNRDISGKDDVLIQRLNCVLERCEANTGVFSEIDGIIWDRLEKPKLFFFENKFKGEFERCSAIDKRDKECRLHRTSKEPEDNGCSYWGEGEGGDAFKRRFPRNLVGEYFKNSFSKPENLTDDTADCYKYYQLMRNVIIGKELAKDIGADFTLVSIISKKHNYEKNKKVWEEFIGKIKDSSAIFLTWEDVLKAVEEDNRKRTKRLAEWLKDKIKD